MRAKAIVASLIIWAAHSTYAFAVEPLVVDPDATQFSFTSSAQGANKFCNLIVSAVKLPAPTIRLKAIAMQRPGENMVFGYSIVALESTIVYGIPSTSRELRIKEANILSDYFSSKWFVEKVKGEDALYLVKGTALGDFTGTMIRGIISSTSNCWTDEA